jgi:hypothetical protein
LPTDHVQSTAPVTSGPAQKTYIPLALAPIVNAGERISRASSYPRVRGAIAYGKIRSRLARLSRVAGVRRTDGSELVLRPHDCRRIFASEHLNNNTPRHVVQALLGHASPDTVMVYAKLYPATLIDEYRKTVRATFLDFHGADSLRAPDATEWQRFAGSLELRDMGTRLCALPAGERCSRGLVCVGCSSAQPKKSAVPIFQRMLPRHQAGLDRARNIGEPAGQLAPANSKCSASVEPYVEPTTSTRRRRCHRGRLNQTRAAWRAARCPTAPH